METVYSGFRKDLEEQISKILGCYPVLSRRQAASLAATEALYKEKMRRFAESGYQPEVDQRLSAFGQRVKGSKAREEANKLLS